MSLTKNVIYLSLASVLVLAFQNCSQTRFGTGGADANSLSKLDGNLTESYVSGSISQPGSEEHIAEEQESSEEVSNGEDPGKRKGDGDKGQDLNLCILQGPGKSLRIGYAEAALKSTVGAPTDVCMSANACLNIISKKFEVKEIFPQPCKGLLHNVAVKMTDAEIQVLVDKIK